MLNNKETEFIYVLSKNCVVDKTALTITLNEGFNWRAYWQQYFTLLEKEFGELTTKREALKLVDKFKSAIRKWRFLRSVFTHEGKTYNGEELITAFSITTNEQLRKIVSECEVKIAYEFDESVLLPKVNYENKVNYNSVNVVYKEWKRPEEKIVVKPDEIQVFVKLEHEEVWSHYAAADNETDASTLSTEAQVKGFLVSLRYPGEENRPERIRTEKVKRPTVKREKRKLLDLLDFDLT